MTNSNNGDHQRLLDSQAKRERCQRLLAGTPKTTTAAKLFDEAAQAEAERLLEDAKAERMEAESELAEAYHHAEKFRNQSRQPANILFKPKHEKQREHPHRTPTELPSSRLTP